MVMNETLAGDPLVSHWTTTDPSTAETVPGFKRGLTWIGKDTQIGNTGWMLAVSMAVEWQQADDYVIAVNPWVDDYGHGNTEQEAKEDLLLSLADFRDSLERQVGAMSDELNQTLGKLREMLVRRPD